MVIAVHVQPGASTESLRAVAGRGWVLRVRAKPVDGAANARAREIIAAALGVRAAKVTLRIGEHAREKVFVAEGDEDDLAGRLEVLASAAR